MSQGRNDPWSGERMSRSDAARRYHNLVEYQLRPMLGDRRLSDDERINVLKRIVREASRFKYESGVVAGAGTREEVIELTEHIFKPEAPYGEELKDWYKRMIRAFGASLAEE